jgi:hypothetical protein
VNWGDEVLTNLAVSEALGGDCLADVALPRAEPELFGPVVSDPTVSRRSTLRWRGASGARDGMARLQQRKINGRPLCAGSTRAAVLAKKQIR